VARKFRADRNASENGKARAKANADKHFGKKAEEEKPDAKRVLPDLLAADNGPKARDFDHHYKTALGFKKKLESAQGHYRNALKSAKEAGIDPAVITATMKWADRDPLEAQMYFKQLRETFAVAGVEVQLDIFNESSISRNAQIYDDGFKAGKAAKGIDTNPHDANTPAGQLWMKGWHDGQAENMTFGQTPKPKADSLGALN
jgi:ribosome modulation factor